MQNRTHSEHQNAQTPNDHADRLERLKRASLRDQAVRAIWQLGALLRRVEREAPHVHQRLRIAVEALQLLGAQLQLDIDARQHEPVDTAPTRFSSRSSQVRGSAGRSRSKHEQRDPDQDRARGADLSW